jgi:hypothetical protein
LNDKKELTTNFKEARNILQIYRNLLCGNNEDKTINSVGAKFMEYMDRVSEKVRFLENDP